MEADPKSDQAAAEDRKATIEDRSLPTTKTESQSSDTGSNHNNPVAVKANADFRVHGCQVMRGRLDHLWNLLKKDFPDNSYTSMEYKRRGKVESKFEAQSIDDLLAAVGKLTPGDNLENLDNLWLYISGGGRTAHIRFGGEYDFFRGEVSVSVSGDEEWVYGRSNVVRAFLESTRSSPLLGRGCFRSVLGPIGCLAALAIAIPSIDSYAQDKPLEFPLYLNLLLFVALGALGTSIGTAIDRHNGGRIILSESSQKRFGSFELISLIVSALTLVATVAAILVAHSDVIHGH